MSQVLARRGDPVTHQSRSHRRLSSFVRWIKPEKGTRETIQKQAADVRRVISGQAAKDSLLVLATPDGGSFAKHTGLRRHMRGGLEVEGLDVDLPFVVKPTTTEGERIDELLRRFDGYAEASYPNTPRRITASSVELQFTATKLNYDLVPMLVAHIPDHQIILKRDGSRRLTSVAKHTEFVRSRTRTSDALDGRVKFNECIRLLKWWRCVRLGESGTIDEVRTMLIELLGAFAFDRFKVQYTYTETLFQWFSFLASVTAQRTQITFSDYPTVEAFRENAPSNPHWRVIDPVNINNNIVHGNWGNIELQEFAAWFAAARDAFARLIAHENAGNDSTVDAILVQQFGNPILTHGVL